jgi:hypothetical protein
VSSPAGGGGAQRREDAPGHRVSRGGQQARAKLAQGVLRRLDAAGRDHAERGVERERLAVDRRRLAGREAEQVGEHEPGQRLGQVTDEVDLAT